LKLTEKLINFAEVCGELSVSRQTIWKWCRQGAFPQPIHIGGRRLAWAREDVEAWLRSRPTGVVE